MVAVLALLDDVRTELNLFVWLFTYARKGPKPRARRTHENVIVAAVAVAPAAAGWSNEKNKSEIKILCVFLGGDGFSGVWLSHAHSQIPLQIKRVIFARLVY